MHNSKAGLMLMELMIVILFFSICSAVCIQLFVKAHILNTQTEERTQANLILQNVAEGFYVGDDFFMMPEVSIGYDESWNICPVDSAYYIETQSYDCEDSIAILDLSMIKASDNSEILSISLEKNIPSKVTKGGE